MIIRKNCIKCTEPNEKFQLLTQPMFRYMFVQ